MSHNVPAAAMSQKARIFLEIVLRLGFSILVSALGYALTKNTSWQRYAPVVPAEVLAFISGAIVGSLMPFRTSLGAFERVLSVVVAVYIIVRVVYLPGPVGLLVREVIQWILLVSIIATLCVSLCFQWLQTQQVVQRHRLVMYAAIVCVGCPLAIAATWLSIVFVYYSLIFRLGEILRSLLICLGIGYLIVKMTAYVRQKRLAG